MLKRLVIENYRSCLRASFDPHPQLSVLIGPNGSGKTNILQTIMLLNKLAGQSERFPTHRPETGNARIRALFQEGRVAAGLRLSFDPFKADTTGDVRALQKWSLREQDGRKVSFEIPLAFPSVMGPRWADVYRRQHRYIDRRAAQEEVEIPDWAARAATRVANFCRGIKYYSASQFTNPGSSPVSFEVDEEEEISGQRSFRRGHLRLLYDMYSAKMSASDGRYERFLNVVGRQGLRLIDALDFRRVRTSSTTYSVRVGGKLEVRKRSKLLVIPRITIGKFVLSPKQLSEGTFKTLALLFNVITEDSDALLIEEPEVCVHHGLLSSILELIKSYSQRRQMIISTHSDYVLDQVQPGNVYSVSFGKETGTVVHHIPKTMSRKELSALRDYLAREGNLGEYWREGGLGSLS